MNNMSICINLEYLLLNEDNENSVIEKLLMCKKINHAHFNVTFWYKDIKEVEIKAFVKRNENILFELNSHITKNPKNIWFLVSTKLEMSDIYSRYTWDGDNVVQGIDEYISLSKNVHIREKRER